VSAERGEKRAFAWKQVLIQLFFWIMIVKDFIKDKSVGWLRLVGSIKLYVSFAKEPYKRNCMLQETCHFIDPTDRSHPI